MRDLRAAIAFYPQRLGFSLQAGEPPGFAGVHLGRAQMFLEQAVPARRRRLVSSSRTLTHFAFHQGVAGAAQPVDQAYGLRYAIRDHDGNRLSFGQRLSTAGQPIPIERA